VNMEMKIWTALKIGHFLIISANIFSQEVICSFALVNPLKHEKKKMKFMQIMF
jgi:hypothetical protein